MELEQTWVADLLFLVSSPGSEQTVGTWEGWQVEKHSKPQKDMVERAGDS